MSLSSGVELVRSLSGVLNIVRVGFSILSLILCTIVCADASSQKPSNKDRIMYRNFYVLGDSLSDSGAFIGSLNGVLDVAKEFDFLKWVDKIYFAPPFYQSRSFSNGPVAVECVANQLGLPMTPGWNFSVTPALKEWMIQKKAIETNALFDSLKEKAGKKMNTYNSIEQIGTNYAFAGARASMGNALPDFLLFNQFQLKNQVRTLLKHHADISSEDLVLIMIGGNDIVAAVADKNPTAIIDESVAEISNALDFLAKNSNLKNIVVANVADMGLVPEFVNTSLQKLATSLSEDFNQKLSLVIKKFSKKFAKIQIKSFDVAGTLKNAISEDTKMGYNAKQACISDIASHKNSSTTLLDLILFGRLDASYNSGCNEQKILQYVFFDLIHPTKSVHHTAADVLYNLVAK